MNVQEMVMEVRIAIGDDMSPFTISTPRIFKWLSDAYLRIQVESDRWKFFHNRGLILTTEADVAEYRVFKVKEVDKQSVYCNKVGDLTRFPLYFMEYEDWVHEQQVNIQRTGNQIYLIKLPDSKYRVVPTPTEAWEIYGDVWYKPCGFYNLDDYPIWDETYHGLVVWEALKVAGMEWPDDKKALRIQTNVNANLPIMRRAFNYTYLEDKKGACPLL